ncbi:MAG: glucosaminidase domain-containing protein [Sarcina sp.]
MSNKKILTTLAIAGAIIAVGQVQAKAATFQQAVVANLNGYPYLHLRSSATTSSSILDDIPKGTKLNVIAENNGWAKVEYEGTIGFVSSYYLNNLNENNSNSQGNSNTIYTNYNTSMSNYATMQNQMWGKASTATYKECINPENASSKYEFLRIDRYRSIDVNGLNAILENQGVLEGQAQVINDAAKTYNIDPVYLAAQTILETGYGQSTLAQGVTIDSIANTNAPIYQNGQLVGYQMIKLPQPVTVFNLFGIGARNNLPGFSNRALILGTTYAYNQGWTSVPKAIYGAARFLSNTYVNNNIYEQNTPYKLRYASNLNNVWHEYATKPYYSASIGSLISQYSYLYNNSDTFLFDKPVFSN